MSTPNSLWDITHFKLTNKYAAVLCVSYTYQMERNMKQEAAARLSTVDDSRLVISVEEAGALADLGRNSAYAAAKRGDIPTIRIGKLLKVPKAAWLKKLAGET